MKQTTMIIAELLVLFLIPALMVYLTKRNSLFRRISPIVLCYCFGFLLSLLPISYDKELSSMVASVLVALAIPLLLFSFDLRSIRQLAKPMLIGFALIIVSVILVSSAAAFIGAGLGMENVTALSGMATGLYVGGTANLFAVGSALLRENASTIINLANIADSIVGSIYLLVLLTVLKPLYTRFLGTRESKRDNALSSAAAEPEYDYSLLPREKRGIWRLVGVVALAAACFGCGVLAELLINGNLDGSLFIMITVSVLGILFSLIRPVREAVGSYQVGQYLILIFSLGLSMSMDLSKLVSGILPTLLYFSAIQILSLALHFLLCKIFHIDGGSAIITGTAGIYGPPFIAPVANAYGDRSLIAPGVICGTLGLVLGNLLGISLALVLRVFLP